MKLISPKIYRTHNKEHTDMSVNAAFILMFLTLFFGIVIALFPVLERKQYQSLQERKLEVIEQKISRERIHALSAESEKLTDNSPKENHQTTLHNLVEIPDVDGIGILRISKINMKLPIVAGVSEEQLKTTAGWVTQTAPIGEIGNAVIAGHRSYTYGRHFNRLGELDIGDFIEYDTINGIPMTFKVTTILTVEPDDPVIFEHTPVGTAQLTLCTCTPISTGTHRLIIRAERMDER